MSDRVNNYQFVSCRHSLAFQNQVKTKIHIIMRVFPSICVPLKPNQAHWTLASPLLLYYSVNVCFCYELQKFRVIPVDLSIGGGELTPTMKLKRKVIQEKYSDLIAEMYGEG